MKLKFGLIPNDFYQYCTKLSDVRYTNTRHRTNIRYFFFVHQIEYKQCRRKR